MSEDFLDETIRDIPEVEEKLKSGQVQETQASQLQSFLRHQDYSKEEKLILLQKMEGKSTRETERLLSALNPEEAKPEKVKPINATEVEIRFTADEELQTKFERLRDLLGFQLEDQSFATLIAKLADIALTKLDRNRQAPPALKGSHSETRYIPEKTKTRVYQRDQGQCTFQTKDGKRCTSKYALPYYSPQMMRAA